MDPKKPKTTLVSGRPPLLRCSKCNGGMVSDAHNPKVKVCSSCGNRAGTVRLS